MERTLNTKTTALSLLFVLLTCSCFVKQTRALSITVLKEECVYEYALSQGDPISGNFVVVDHHLFWSDDHPGIDFHVYSPSGSVVHSLTKTSGDKFEFRAPQAGMYKFCFHSDYSTAETVNFHIHTGHIPNEHDLHAKDEHLDPVNVKIAELKEALEGVTNEQEYLKARDAQHRHTNESTQRRITFYTVGEYILLVLVSGLQVLYIRSLFRKTDGYTRV